jgi:hypothetical protein
MSIYTLVVATCFLFSRRIFAFSQFVLPCLLHVYILRLVELKPTPQNGRGFGKLAI